MAKQYVVLRGVIHRDNKVVAREGDPYSPKNAAERERLLARGVIAEVEGGRKGGSQASAAPAGNEPPAGGTEQGGEAPGQTGSDQGTGG
ncbi:hypothetical protein LG302_00985 [Halomonas organivorans]